MTRVICIVILTWKNLKKNETNLSLGKAGFFLVGGPVPVDGGKADLEAVPHLADVLATRAGHSTPNMSFSF